VQTTVSILWLPYHAYTLVDIVTRVLALIRNPAYVTLLIAEAHTILDGAACFSGMTTPILSCLCAVRTPPTCTASSRHPAARRWQWRPRTPHDEASRRSTMESVRSCSMTG
jgi:hypothetical protein